MAGGFEHETNTFSNLLVTAETVAAIRQEGQELLDSSRGVRSTMAGLLDECEALDARHIGLQHHLEDGTCRQFLFVDDRAYIHLLGHRYVIDVLNFGHRTAHPGTLCGKTGKDICLGVVAERNEYIGI